jgi:hypothetical protein
VLDADDSELVSEFGILKGSLRLGGGVWDGGSGRRSVSGSGIGIGIGMVMGVAVFVQYTRRIWV